MSNWSTRQVARLLVEMETYRADNNLQEEEVIATIEGPAIIYLADIGWDGREVYGTHTEKTPRIKKVQV